MLVYVIEVSCNVLFSFWTQAPGIKTETQIYIYKYLGHRARLITSLANDVEEPICTNLNSAMAGPLASGLLTSSLMTLSLSLSQNPFCLMGAPPSILPFPICHSFQKYLFKRFIYLLYVYEYTVAIFRHTRRKHWIHYRCF